MITVLGSGGFIGSSLVKKLKETNTPYNAPARGDELGKNMGHVIYCIGLTADFRTKPFDTIEAHICLLNKILEHGEFESLTYLSSTRVYINCREEEVFENTPITVSIDHPDELYTLSKLTGERLCLSSGRKTRIVRLSNVYGNDYSSENFIIDIIKKVQAEKFIKFFTTPASAKDYISIDALCDLLVSVATSGKQEIYNLASGENLSNAEIIEMLKIYYEFNYEFDANAKEIVFPRINIDRIKNEFGFSVSNNKKNFSQVIKKYGNDTN